MAQPDDILDPWASNANYSTGPLSGQPAKIEPTASQLANGHVAGESFKGQLDNHHENLQDLWIIHRLIDANGDFGDGSDGDVTISGNTTLTRDMYYSGLRVETGFALNTAGFRIFVSGLLAIEAGGRIHNDGGDGGDAIAGGTGGAAGAAAAAASGTTGAGGAGAIGVNGLAGVGAPGTTVADSVGGSGGAGGATVVPVLAGGTAGTATAPAADDGGVGTRESAKGQITGRNGASAQTTLLRGGGGGGSGACDSATDASGGGGGGAGIVSIHAHTILIDPDATPAISADGGDAGDGESSGQDVGGSGGGGGGSVRIVYRRLFVGVSVSTATPTEPADLAAAGVFVQALGGLASAGLSGADNGVDGSPGTVAWWRI